MTIKNKLTFKVPGNETVFAVRRANAKESQKLQAAYNETFMQAITSNAPLRAKVEEIARRQGVWDDVKQEEYNKLQKQLWDYELTLQKGGVKKSVAKGYALEMRRIRLEQRLLLADRNSIDQNTCESQAENTQFNHRVAMCLVQDEDNKPYCKDYDDYIDKLNNGDAVVMEGIKQMSYLQYNLDPNYEFNLPENKFLKEYNFVDDKLRLLNKEGRLVDEKGRLVNEEGRLINEKNELVDQDGNVIDEKGNYKVEFKPFLDD